MRSAVERIWNIQGSQSQTLTLALRSKSLTSFKLLHICLMADCNATEDEEEAASGRTVAGGLKPDVPAYQGALLLYWRRPGVTGGRR